MEKYLCLLTDAPVDLPRDADVQVDRLVARQAARAVTPEDGIVPLPARERAWSWLVNVTWHNVAEGRPVAATMGHLKTLLGADVVCYVDHNELIAPGGMVGGVKNVGFLRRAAGMTRDGFAEHWRDVHAPITLSYDPTFTGYVQNTIRNATAPVHWDGIVEQWFDSREDLDAHVALAAEGRPRITADIPNFVSEMDIQVAIPQSLQYRHNGSGRTPDESTVG